MSLSASQHRDELAAIRAILTQVAQQQAANNQAIAQLTAEQQLSRQDINTLTASIQDLRNLVADYIQGRSETQWWEENESGKPLSLTEGLFHLS